MHKHRANRIPAVFAIILLCLGGVSPLLAQTSPQKEYTSYKTLIEKAVETGTAKQMSLDNCIELALRKNLSIELDRYQPLVNQESLKAALGVYDYVLDSELSYSKNENPITDRLRRELLGIETFQNTNYNFNLGVSKYFSTGGSLTITTDNNRAASNTNVYNPTFNGSVAASFTQPLWKNFKIDGNRRSIKMAEKDRQISEIDFELKVSDVLKSVEDTYWSLVNAIEQQNIQIQSRELALIQLRDNQKRVEIGTLAPIVITQTRAEVAQSEQAVIAAEADIILNLNLLKNLIANDWEDPLWKQTIIPTDKPVVADRVPELRDSIMLAVKNRPEMRQLELSLEKDDIDIHYYENQLRPKLDLVASYNPNGVAGPNIKEIVRDDQGNPVIGPDGLPLTQDGPFTGRLGTVYEQILKQDYVNYSIALRFQYPIGNNTAKANLAMARLGRDQTATTHKQTRQSVGVEVLNAVQTIEVNRKSLESAIVARQFQEEQLDGQNKRYQAGLTTNFEVLQTQRDLASAKAAELTALINLKKSFTAFQKATFTILEQHQLEIARQH